MTTSNERGLPYVRVAQVCDLLLANGYLPEKISLRDILGETLEGSLTTIAKHRERWLRERRGAATSPIHIDDSELDELRTAVAQIFAKKTDNLRAEYEVGAATNRAVIERLELDMEEALKSNDQLYKQCEAAVCRIEQLRHDVIAANLRANALAAANAKMGEAHRIGVVDDRPFLQIPPEPKADLPAGSGGEASK